MKNKLDTYVFTLSSFPKMLINYFAKEVWKYRVHPSSTTCGWAHIFIAPKGAHT